MKPSLLFLTPTAPTPTGHGLGMRAHAILRTLARQYRVFLLVLNHPPEEPDALEALNALCTETAFRPIGLWSRRDARLRRLAARWPAAYRRLFPAPCEWSRIARADVTHPFSVREFDVAHVFRLYAAPLLARLHACASWQQAWLDVDDLESLTRRRLAALHRLNGEPAAAAQFEIEASQYEMIERDALQRFDRLFVCSPADRERVLATGLHPRPEVVPNIANSIAAPAAEPHDEFRMLFAGNLGYVPNADAILYFCRDILPRIGEQADRAVTLEVAGGGATRPFARAMAGFPGVRRLGWVRDLGAAYARADAVVVPLRAGGGTRIKVLEAFAYGRPVVSTPEGIEGIAADHGIHALIAGSAEVFADACVRLIREPALRGTLAARARELVLARYSEGALAAALLGPIGARPLDSI